MVVIDQDLNRIPSDLGHLNLEDLSAEVVKALEAAQDHCASPDGDNAFPNLNLEPNSVTPADKALAPLVQASIRKPPMMNVRSRKFQLVVPKELRATIKTWQKFARIFKNKAICLVNKADTHGHPHLLNYRLNQLIGNNNSKFVRQQPWLKACLVYA